jgi:acyl-CoA thioesterase I
VIAVWWLGVVLELPFHLMPVVPRMGDPQVHVVGDSISAGLGGDAAPWPLLLSERHHVLVRNLARPGATVTGAMRQVEQISGEPSLVVVEIGGNDILGETTPKVFERGLDALLARLRAGGHTIVLLELPLPPFANRFGSAQRRVARHHGALLVPKRLLLGVFTSEGATMDTVHLTDRGNGLMAKAVWAVIKHAFGA